MPGPYPKFRQIGTFDVEDGEIENGLYLFTAPIPEKKPSRRRIVKKKKG